MGHFIVLSPKYYVEDEDDYFTTDFEEPIHQGSGGSVCLVLRVRQAAEKGGEDFDAVPEILKAQVFVGGVLIVVVVRDGKGDDGTVVTLLEKIHWETAAGSRQADRLVAGHGHDAGELAREGQIE
jgi:hypothetical protein